MKSKHPLSWLYIILPAFWLLIQIQPAHAAGDLSIGDYQLVSSKRISRTVFEYTYRATATNASVDATGVSAILNVNFPGVTVLDNKLEFGDVPGGANKISEDTFSIRQDRQFSFSTNSLQWAITALLKPSDPQVVEIGTGVNAISANTLLYDGQVDIQLPAGKTLDSLFVVSGLGGQVPITANGQFTIRLNANATGLLRVADSVGNVYLLKLYPKEEGLADENPVIDAESTAIALMAMQPGIITTDPYIDAVMFALLAKLPEIQTLAELISDGLLNGTFQVNGQFSSEILVAMENASFALANMTKEDFYASSIPNKLNTLIAKWLNSVISPAYAEISFTAPCSDIFNERFAGSPGNQDEVCIGAEIAAAGEVSTFYMSNPKTRWVFFAENPSDTISNFSLIDIIPPKHISIPNTKDIFLAIGEVSFTPLINRIFKNTSTNYAELVTERFRDIFVKGPAKSKSNVTFMFDGDYKFNTIGFSRDNLVIPDIKSDIDIYYYSSLGMTVLTEGVFPWISVVKDIKTPGFFNFTQAEIGEKGVFNCVRSYEDWLLSVVVDLARLNSGNSSVIGYSEWFVNNFLTDTKAYKFASCIMKDSVFQFLEIEKIHKLLIDTLGSNLFIVDKIVAAGSATFNTANMLEAFFDPNLASLDSYSVKIGNPNTAPVTYNDSANAQSGVPVLINVLSNDTDANGDTLSITVISQGANGGTVTNNGSNVTYTSTKNFVGTDTFTYSVSDGKGGSDTATVTVQVSAAPVVNSNPVAIDDTKTAQSSVSTSVDVLANDTDADGDTLAITSVTQAANGSVTNKGNNVTYSSNAGFVGEDSFTYTVSDNKGGSATATVTVTVTAIAPPATWSIDPANVSVSESAGTVTFTITRTSSSAAQTVYVSTVQDQGTTNNGDYVGKLNEALNFEIGDKQKSVSVIINKDDQVEGPETFRLIVQQSPTDPLDKFLASATFTIIDDAEDRSFVVGSFVNGPYPMDMATLGNGKFVAIFSRDLGVMEVIIFDADGTQTSDVIKVDTTANSPTSPRVASLDDGGFVIVWYEGIGFDDSPAPMEVVFQVFDGDGRARTTRTTVTDNNVGWAWESDVAPLADGGFVVVWTEDSGIRARTFSQDGVAIRSEIVVRSGSSSRPSVSPLSSEMNPESQSYGFAVAWVEGTWAATTGDVVERVVMDSFTISGDLVQRDWQAWNGVSLLELDVLEPDTQVMDSLEMTVLQDGGLIVAWREGEIPVVGQLGVEPKPVGRIVDATGTLSGGRIDLNSPSASDPLATTSLPEIFALDAGGFVAIYEFREIWSDKSAGIRMQVFNSEGNRLGTERELVRSSEEKYVSGWAEATQLLDGRYAVTWVEWSSFPQTIGQIFDDVVWQVPK